MGVEGGLHSMMWYLLISLTNLLHATSFWSTLSKFCNNFVGCQSHLLNAWPLEREREIEREGVWEREGNTHRQQYRVFTAQHLKNAKVINLIGLFAVTLPASPVPLPLCTPLPLCPPPRTAHSSIALRFALLSSKVSRVFFLFFCNFPRSLFSQSVEVCCSSVLPGGERERERETEWRERGLESVSWAKTLTAVS